MVIKAAKNLVDAKTGCDPGKDLTQRVESDAQVTRVSPAR